FSMKSMVEGECGGSNPLVSLANNYGQTNERVGPSVSRGISSLMPSSSRGEKFAQDFLVDQARKTAQPATFDMKALSRQLPPSSQAAAVLSSQWTKEFNPINARPNSRSSQLASQWSSSYHPSSSPMESAWRSATSTPQPLTGGQMMMANAPQSSSTGMWSSEFLDRFDSNVTDKVTLEHIASDWTSEYSNQKHEEQLWQKLEGEWTKQREEFMRNGWEQETEERLQAIQQPYIHQSENPFVQDQSALRIGDEAMRGGDLERAILAYEAAVQNNPQDAMAWCRLGLSHAENEHDDRAIQAFRKSLEIDPRNEEALLSLSVSLANECLENDALEQLEKWLASHTGGDPTQIKRAKPTYSSFLDHSDFDRVESIFLSAAARQNSADAELQNALGVLYNLGRNFERAVDSLKLAIATKPDDPRLWNRLGATLANGDRTPEAISAYREALRLYPGYVRARYNLGISCMHLNSYREAVNHFADALDLQKGGAKEQSAIWGPLRSSAVRCLAHAPQLLPFVDQRDLVGLKRALSTLPPSDRSI
ncbi:prx-5, partial [Pristionchus pacificus]